MISENKSRCHVHTFGIGSGVSTELIKNCANAGHGHYSFITKPEEIEKKVMEVIQKDLLKYISIRSPQLLDENRKLINKFSEESISDILFELKSK